MKVALFHFLQSSMQSQHYQQKVQKKSAVKQAVDLNLNPDEIEAFYASQEASNQQPHNPAEAQGSFSNFSMSQPSQ